MKVTTEIRSGKTGASTRTSVDGEPKNEAERIIFTCLQAGINAGLERAAQEIEARAKEKQILETAPKVAAKIAVLPEATCPDCKKSVRGEQLTGAHTFRALGNLVEFIECPLCGVGSPKAQWNGRDEGRAGSA